jgi:Cys-tRNA(Pro)/Cys-tRNA(Cys) deacylase
VDKTLAMKLLEGKNVAYKPVTYPETMRDAAAIAERLGLPPEQMFKTLVVRAPKGDPTAKPMLVMIPGDRELDLKKLAKAVGAKKLKMASHQQAEQMTGLQVGGISPLVLVNKGFDIYLDEAARRHDAIFVSAGQKGINLRVAVADVLDVTGARWVDASRF